MNQTLLEPDLDTEQIKGFHNSLIYKKYQDINNHYLKLQLNNKHLKLSVNYISVIK